MTFAKRGILSQTDTSFSSRLVVLPDPREAQADPQADLETIQPFGQTVSGEREDKVLTALTKVISAKPGRRH